MNDSTSNPSISIKENLLNKKKEIYKEKIFQNYNVFVDCYNNLLIEESNYFFKVKENNFYNFFVKLQKKFLSKLIYFILSLIPFMNIVLYCLVLSIFIIYHKAFIIFKKNKKINKNPFEEMVYSPELCQLLKKNYHIYEIEIKSVLFKNFYFVKL